MANYYLGKVENIIKSLHKNKMNTILRLKEDIFHRLYWKEKYIKKWRLKFKNFTQFSHKNNINVIAGIAPGLILILKS